MIKVNIQSGQFSGQKNPRVRVRPRVSARAKFYNAQNRLKFFLE